MADRDRLTAIVFEALDLDGRRDRDHELAAEVVDKLLAGLDNGAAPGEVQQMRSVLAEARELAEGWAKSEDRGWISPLGDELLDVLRGTSTRLAALQRGLDSRG